MTDSANCPHCGEQESELHLFFHCPFAARIWSLPPFKETLIPSKILSLKAGIERSNKLICLPPTGIGEDPLFPWIFWTIWTSPNQLIFNKKQIQTDETLLIAISRAKEWQLAQSNQAKPPSPRLLIPHPAAPISTTTCLTDAAWKDASLAGLGWIFQNHPGLQNPHGSATESNVLSPLMAEALATLKAVKVAIESGLSHLHFASDSQMLVKALNLKLHPKELHGIQYDILSLSSRYISCSFNFIPRDLNYQADCLAKEALRMFYIEP